MQVYNIQSVSKMHSLIQHWKDICWRAKILKSPMQSKDRVNVVNGVRNESILLNVLDMAHVPRASNTICKFAQPIGFCAKPLLLIIRTRGQEYLYRHVENRLPFLWDCVPAALWLQRRQKLTEYIVWVSRFELALELVREKIKDQRLQVNIENIFQSSAEDSWVVWCLL